MAKKQEVEVVQIRNGYEQKSQIETMEEDEGEEMDLGEIDLDEIEKKYDKAGQGYVSRKQLELIQEAIICTKAHQHLGITAEPQKGSKRKYTKEELKREGRRISNELHRLV